MALKNLVIKNDSGADVLIQDFGIVVANGGQETLGDLDDIRDALTSEDLRQLAKAGTLVLNDGTSDIPSGEVDDFIQYHDTGEDSTGPTGSAGSTGPTGPTGPSGSTGVKPSYAQIVTVAKSGGDYDSIKDAIDSITDASVNKPYAVIVYPGVYAEDPIVHKPYIALTAESTNSVYLYANNNNSPQLSLPQFCSAEGLSFLGATNAACVEATGQYAGIENCKFHGGLYAVKADGANRQIVVEECKMLFDVEYAIYAADGGRIDCSNVLSYATNFMVADGGTIWTHNSGTIGATNGLYALGGGSIYPHNVTLESVTYGIRTGSSGTNTIEGDGVTCRGTSTYDIYQEASGGDIDISSARFRATRLSIADWSTCHIQFNSDEEGEDRATTMEEFSVGAGEYGQQSYFGRGPSMLRGLKVLTTDNTAGSTSDGSNLTDVTDEATSPTGSTFTFQGTGANYSILFTIDATDQRLSDKLKHFGLDMLIDTAAVESTKRSFAFEVWNGSAWVEVESMAFQIENGYLYANEVFIRASNQERINLGITEDTAWSKKTIDGTNAYWSRIRITDSLTTAPTFQQAKLCVSTMAISSEGFPVMVGRARWLKTLQSAGNIWGETGGVVDSSIDVGSGGVPTGWGHDIKESKINSNGDAIYCQIAIPRGLDTSLPLSISIDLFVDGDSDVDLICSLLPMEVAGVLEADPSGSVVPTQRTLANTETLTSKAAQYDSLTLTGSPTKLVNAAFTGFVVSNYYPGDILLIRFEGDDLNSEDPIIILVNIEGTSFALGEKT